MEKNICQFFLRGACKYGKDCKKDHVMNQPMPYQGNNQFNNNHNNKMNYQNNYHNNKNNNPPHNNNPNPNFNHQNKFGNQNILMTENPMINNTNHNNQINKQNFNNKNTNKICLFFNTIQGCNKHDKCTFLHNYHDSLHHIKREIIHPSQIIGCSIICKYFDNNIQKPTQSLFLLLKTALLIFFRYLHLNAPKAKKSMQQLLD